jgi:hypothetical protein
LQAKVGAMFIAAGQTFTHLGRLALNMHGQVDANSAMKCVQVPAAYAHISACTGRPPMWMH